jgi:DNA-binding transcriptional regulator LsrR (DeoR family)
MWKCVYLHFEHRMPYVSIARELGIPRTRVSEYVEAALEADLIKLNPPRHLDLETRLQEAYQMRGAVVAVPRRAPAGASGVDELELEDVGALAAEYVQRLIVSVASEKANAGKPVEISLGVACGRTVQATIEALAPRFLVNNGLTEVPVRIYPLSYSSSPRLAANSPNAAVAVLNSKWAGSGNVTAFTFHGNADRGVSEESPSSPVHAGECDISIVGIGAPGSPSAHSRQLFDEAHYRIDGETASVRSTEPQNDLAVEVAGEINGQPFSAARFQDDALPNLFGLDGIWRGVHWRQLRELARRDDKYVIAIACGRAMKGDTIAIALAPHLRCFNALVTDDETAEHVLRQAGETDFVPAEPQTRVAALR